MSSEPDTTQEEVVPNKDDAVEPESGRIEEGRGVDPSVPSGTADYKQVGQDMSLTDIQAKNRQYWEPAKSGFAGGLEPTET